MQLVRLVKVPEGKSVRFYPRMINLIKLALIFTLSVQMVEAYVQFVPNEKLADSAEYIVLAELELVSAGETIVLGDANATVLINRLKVIESIKGSWALEKTLILNTFKFDGWMEDNVELPSKDSKVLLFLKQDEKGELKPVNGIQGVWPIHKGEPVGAGSGTTLMQIQEMVLKEANSCKSEAFTSLVDTAEMQTEAGNYKEALEAYRKAYHICSMRDLEEQMAWLMGEVGMSKILKSGKII